MDVTILIESLKNTISDLCIRELVVSNKEIYIAYISQITDRNAISKNIIKPIMQYSKSAELTIDLLMNSIIYVDNIFYDDNYDIIYNYIIKGNSIILMKGDLKYLVANTIKIEKREIPSPEIQSSLRGPKDSFTENLDSNLSLIRYRVQDTSLKIDYLSVGSRTKTTVAVIYLKDVANDSIVSQIESKIKSISIDGICESGYIQKFLSNKDSTFFPQIGIVERSDLACVNILEGKVCILVNGSNIGLITPKNLIEFLDTSDDHYDNIYLNFFLKSLRVLSLIISLTLSSLYVLLVAFQSDMLPSEYILALASSRVTVPVNAVTEAILMELILEILRESNIRLPRLMGSSISIVGTIVIGQALVFAGLVSPPMVVIVALTSVTSFTVSDYTIMNSVRLLKFILIFLTASLGLFGFAMGLSLIFIKITSITSFGIPYTSPFIPFNLDDMKNYILSNPVTSKFRPNFLKTKNKKRS